MEYNTPEHVHRYTDSHHGDSFFSPFANDN